MVSSIVIDVVLGLVFVYWFFSALCSAAIEFVAAQRDARAKMLSNSLKTLLGDLVGKGVMSHALVAPASGDASTAGPSRIHRDMFANAFLDAVNAFQGGKISREEIDNTVASIKEPRAKELSPSSSPAPRATRTASVRAS